MTKLFHVSIFPGKSEGKQLKMGEGGNTDMPLVKAVTSSKFLPCHKLIVLHGFIQFDVFRI